MAALGRKQMFETISVKVRNAQLQNRCAAVLDAV
jgi:hypothetical protein